ncbi:L,D-transpeptidase [Nitrosomonas sp. Nm84]|uniref:L,D-transpeptidase n=1 Tax=Nitrosomonas sp. Nm84 TaxID=200124 RepID=UPI0021ABA7F6|nr:L,D-transpeptidase [Nitrosomonas sp. Nm84]
MTKQNSFIHYSIFFLVGMFGLSALHNPVRADNGIWIDVDTIEHTLSVMQGSTIQAVFKNVAIGRYGTTWSKMTKDDKTPLGRFRVGWVNEKSRYYRFFGLDYPNLDTAKRALDENRISEEIWLSILEAKNLGKTPPQNTPLGGHIGIHGIGRGDQDIHHKYNWTNGCIALTNEQIDQLGKWIKPGILVNIR